VNQFTTWNAAQNPKPWTSSNALFSIWIGINDIGNSYYQTGDRAAFSDTLLADEFVQVQKLVRVLPFYIVSCPHAAIQYDAGARNFLFLNVPPVDRSPLVSPFHDFPSATWCTDSLQMIPQGTWATTTEASVIATHNQKITAAVNAFKANHTGVTTYIWDSNAYFNTILDNLGAVSHFPT
jgi:hypothetical protein